MTTRTAQPETVEQLDLRWLADSYEQAQTVRKATGERIRAIMQGRDTTWTVLGTLGEEERMVKVGKQGAELKPVNVWWPPGSNEALAADEMLVAIAKGDYLGPVPLLGRTYHRHKYEEDELRKLMDKQLRVHPAWPWLGRVKGIGPTLGCKILARLDPALADHASSFWSYCGLGTVPGKRYHCGACKVERAWPADYKVTGTHKLPGGTDDELCEGKLIEIAGSGDEIRVAQPRPAKGQKSKYDQYAKKVMYLVGTSFLKAGEGPYEQHYRKHRARLETDRPGWADGRKHLTALRITEKLFLSHLWETWRQALSLSAGDAYALGMMGHTGFIDPWSMVED